MHVNYSNPLSHKLLTHEQEVSLAQKIEKGDKSARDMMIQSNLRLAFSIAKKYFNKGFDSDDLLQESNIGLIKAVDRYDWRKGFRFSTYAHWWIQQSVRRHILKNSSAVNIPAHAKSMIWRVNQIKKEYEEEFGDQPTMTTVAEVLGVDERWLSEVYNSSRIPISLDAQIGGEGRTFGETIPDDKAQIDECLDREFLEKIIRSAISTLSSREMKILRMRFGIYENPSDHENFPITKKQLNKIKGEAHEHA